jgi:exopolysaccharide production protein ExoQ
MPPSLALLVWLVLLLALLRFDPANVTGTSVALWVPLIWVFIVASRLPSQWLGVGGGTQAQAFEEGNPLDRTIYLLLILLAIGILASRSFKWGDFFARNLALVAFVSFALLSVFWSDFPLAAFKKWFRDLGNYLVILVVLSDPCPLEAVRTLLRRVSYLLIPLCILLDKYFPNLSRYFDPWSGIGIYTGATTGKNLLGLVALLSGLFFFWDTITRWSDRKDRRTKRIIRVNVGFFAMSLWVMNTANSATCRVCMVLGCLVVAAAHSKFFRRHPGSLKMLIPSIFLLYLLLAYGLDLNGTMAGAVGKDPTLTDRTKIWAFVLGMHTNSLIGTGYESFWMGPRLQHVWQKAGLGGLTEAHNGYLEVYLNLGIIGVVLLIGFLISGYRNICRRLKSSPSLASLNLALWTIMLFYCVTEAGFRSGYMWTILLLATLALPRLAEEKTHYVSAFESAGTPGRFMRAPLQPTGFRR